MSAPITVAVLAADGATPVATLDNAAGVQWLDELNGVGSAAVRLPMTDAVIPSIAYDQVLTFGYAGSVRFAAIIEGLVWNAVDEAGARWLECSGRGLLSWLGNGVVLPVGGLVKTSPQVRWFNFASIDSGDHDLGVTWGTPVGVYWHAMTGAKAGYPLDWPDLYAQWIWSISPLDPGIPGEQNWFRASFNLTADSDVLVYATADDTLDLYVDGELVLSAAFKVMNTATIHLAAGDHVVAIRGQNKVSTGSDNPACILAELLLVDEDGNPGALVVRTDTSWEVTTEQPQWNAGDVLFTLVTEAQARSVAGLSNLTMDFDATLDSNGDPWTTKVSRSWDVVTTSVLTVALDLAELGLDVWVTPDLVLHAAETRGATRTATLGIGSNIMSWKATGARATGTFGWVLNDLGWFEASDTAGLAAHGRLEVGLSLGATQSDEQTADVIAAAFADIASPQETITDTALVPVVDAIAYVDFDIADTVTGVDKLGATADVRLLSLTVVQDDAGKVAYTPEVEEV